jgi:hypothetical protein
MPDHLMTGFPTLTTDELPPCAHETTQETMLDGSVLIRCARCRYRRVIAPERKP